jgi:hypothetical protein
MNAIMEWSIDDWRLLIGIEDGRLMIAQSTFDN